MAVIYLLITLVDVIVLVSDGIQYYCTVNSKLKWSSVQIVYKEMAVD